MTDMILGRPLKTSDTVCIPSQSLPASSHRAKPNDLEHLLRFLQ